MHLCRYPLFFFPNSQLHTFEKSLTCLSGGFPLGAKSTQVQWVAVGEFPDPARRVHWVTDGEFPDLAPGVNWVTVGEFPDPGPRSVH